MRRKLRAQQREKNKVIVDIAAAQAEEKQAKAPKAETKTAKKGGAKKNDNESN